MKSYHIITFGCQMNEHDSERISGVLESHGLLAAADVQDADTVVVNTCSIREKAEQKFFSELGRLKLLKDAKPTMQIAVAGCIAQQEGESILNRAPYVDLIFGPSDIAKLSNMLLRKKHEWKPIVDISGDPAYHQKQVPASRRDNLKAWVSIMYGCDNFCTYCVVPYLRGRERSRSADDIVSEIRDLALKGYKEVTLLGQNVNSYGKGLSDTTFHGLLKRVNEIPGIVRIRFVTSHPRDLSKELIEAIRDLPKVCEWLHLPVQSGSDAILRSMNRKYTRSEYIERVAELRSAIPDITLSSDIIVGFPGETDQDFNRTIELLNDIRYDSIFAFKYSERPGTAAIKLGGNVPQEVREERLAKVLSLQSEITIQKNKQLVGSVQEVLIDGFSKKGTTLCGRTRGNKVVNFSAPDLRIGTLVQVKITSTGLSSLIGTLCE